MYDETPFIGEDVSFGRWCLLTHTEMCTHKYFPYGRRSPYRKVQMTWLQCQKGTHMGDRSYGVNREWTDDVYCEDEGQSSHHHFGFWLQQIVFAFNCEQLEQTHHTIYTYVRCTHMVERAEGEMIMILTMAFIQGEDHRTDHKVCRFVVGDGNMWCLYTEYDEV